MYVKSNGDRLEFEWDEAKRQKLIAERDADVLVALLIFEHQVLTVVDNRNDYGEVRWISLGIADGDVWLVVHTERAGVTRIITVWKGGRRDRKKYEASFAFRNSSDEKSR